MGSVQGHPKNGSPRESGAVAPAMPSASSFSARRRRRRRRRGARRAPRVLNSNLAKCLAKHGVVLNSNLALRLRPPPPGQAGRGRRRAAARAARALRAARRRGEPALPTHARSCAWRPRVAAQGVLTGMGTNFVDGAACPCGTAPPCRDPKSRPLYYGHAGHLPQHLHYARCLPRWCTTSTLDGLFD